MRVFITGASGFIGSAIVSELLQHGHRVLGLARSEASAAALARAGADVHRGTLEDLDSLRRGGQEADGIIHCAFDHTFVDMAAAGRTDLAAVHALAEVAVGKPLLVTSGIAVTGPNASEDSPATRGGPGSHRLAAEDATRAASERGVRGMVMRMPPSVHGDGDHGFVPMLIAIARKTGVSAYVGDGANRWPAVHRLDAARLYRLALERGSAGASYHGVAETGVPTRQIAEVIGKRLQLPVTSATAEHFGWLGAFFGADVPATSALTRERLGWTPEHAGLLADVDRPEYFTAA